MLYGAIEGYEVSPATDGAVRDLFADPLQRPVDAVALLALWGAGPGEPWPESLRTTVQTLHRPRRLSPAFKARSG